MNGTHVHIAISFQAVLNAVLQYIKL